MGRFAKAGYPFLLESLVILGKMLISIKMGKTQEKAGPGTGISVAKVTLSRCFCPQKDTSPLLWCLKSINPCFVA